MATESFFSNASLAYLASAGAGKDGKTYSIKPTDGTGDFTFSRGSNLTATRVGPTGLIEKGRENLLTYSNDFSNAAWSKTTTSVTSGQTGYDGSSDAWLLTATTTLNAYMQKTGSFSGVNTFSIYAKANTSSFFVLFDSANPYVYFDLGNGTIGTQVSNPIDAKITSVGNGWYRCSITTNNPNNLRIYVVDADGSTAVTNGNSIYIQDAQLEVGLAATDYIESGASTGKAGLLENEPRFDYSGGATCPSLLLEPQRVQLVQYSEYLNGLYNFGITINTNQATSPEGIENANKITANGVSGDHQLYALSIPFTSGTSYTFSIFAKADTNDFVQFVTSGAAFGNNAYANYDLASGVMGTIGSSATASIEDYGNGWYRCILTATATATASSSISLFMITSATAIRGESNTLSTSSFLYGFQCEAGSYPTSYIPNHSGGSATRTEDDCSVTGVSDVIGQTEGTLFVDVDITLTGITNRMIAVNDGTAFGNINMLSFSPQNRFQFEASPINILSSAYPAGRYKVAVVYSAAGAAMWVNGVEVATTTTTTTTTNYSKLFVGGSPYGVGQEKGINQALVFKTRLSNADLATLTTL